MMALRGVECLGICPRPLTEHAVGALVVNRLIPVLCNSGREIYSDRGMLMQSAVGCLLDETDGGKERESATRGVFAYI